jgi:hypothetical protein
MTSARYVRNDQANKNPTGLATGGVYLWFGSTRLQQGMDMCNT